MKGPESCRIAELRPREIQRRLAEAPVVYVPIAPLEWHGPHLPFGVDVFAAEAAAMGACQRTAGLVWPTLVWGTERERSPEQLASLGFDQTDYVVGMDFPKNSLPSAYCPEETLGLVVRESLHQVRSLGARLGVIVNGHGAVNHNWVLKRLEVEFNHTTDMRVYVRLAVPLAMLEAGEPGHADAYETSLMMYEHPDTVDLAQLPPHPEPLMYGDFAVVDHDGFTGQSPDGQVGDRADPRVNASAEHGRALRQQIVDELVAEVEQLMASLTGRAIKLDGDERP